MKICIPRALPSGRTTKQMKSFHPERHKYNSIMSNRDPFPFKEPIVILIGPTAIGKTALSIQLAKEFNFEIISVDSMQVYRYMDIGTAKVTKEEMQGIPHHLIDVVNPDEPFDAGLFEKLSINAIEDIHSRGKRVLLTGGTGMYLAALLNGLSSKLPTFPEIRKELVHQLKKSGHDLLHEELSTVDRTSAKRIHKNDSHRVVRALEIYRGTGRTWSSFIEEHKAENAERFQNILKIGLTCERKKLYERIGQRSNIMLESGFEEEVRGLLHKGYSHELKSMQSIGYSHMIKYLRREWDRSKTVELLTRDTRRYAKRQYTWFNKIKDIEWLETDRQHLAKALVSVFVNTYKQVNTELS
jgi:tRNA dimethylallyltransferase